MEDERAERLGGVDAFDRGATVAPGGVVAGGEYDADGSPVAGRERVARKVAGGCRCQRRKQVAVEQREQGLCLGVAEPAVELQYSRPVGGDDEAGEERADERRPRARTASTGRCTRSTISSMSPAPTPGTGA